MKQSFTRKIKWLLPMLLVAFSTSISVAQIKTADVKTQSHEIIISISGIAYEDANLSSLKESLKKNPNVKSIKPTYAQETAKITVAYVGSSGELLDEIPENIKQFFKLTTLNDNSIAFAYKNSLQKTDSVVTKVSTAVNSNDTDCKSCSYFPLCKYDYVRSFQGIVYKGINYDQGIFYYYCDHGILIQKHELVNNSTTFVDTHIILKNNEPEGANWSQTEDMGNGVSDIFQYFIISKGKALQLNDNIYKDVMIVYHKITQKTLSGETVIASVNNYFAKGAGLIKTENVDNNYDVNQTMGDLKMSDSIRSVLPGSIDETIVGTWVCHDSVMRLNYIYKFNEDGTWEYYVGDVSPGNKFYRDNKIYWSVNGNSLERWCSDWNPKRFTAIMQKKNDPATGKPTLVIQFKGTEYRTYFSQDGKAAWK